MPGRVAEHGPDSRLCPLLGIVVAGLLRGLSLRRRGGGGLASQSGAAGADPAHRPLAVPGRHRQVEALVEQALVGRVVEVEPELAGGGDALEAEPERSFEAELKQAVSSLGVPRGRVIVITDSLQLALMRRLGLGFQRVPAPGELGLDFDDPAYRRLLDERFDLAMSPWHGKWPMRGIGAGSAALRKEAAAAPAAAEASREPDRDDSKGGAEA